MRCVYLAVIVLFLAAIILFAVQSFEIVTVAAIYEGYPFDREVPDTHSYVTFVSDPDVLDELAALKPGRGERIERGEGVIYWQVARSKTLESTIGKTMGKKRYKSATTTRNLRTIEKVLRR